LKSISVNGEERHRKKRGTACVTVTGGTACVTVTGGTACVTVTGGTACVTVKSSGTV
jgi:hypothetical protein